MWNWLELDLKFERVAKENECRNWQRNNARNQSTAVTSSFQLFSAET